VLCACTLLKAGVITNRHITAKASVTIFVFILKVLMVKEVYRLSGEVVMSNIGAACQNRIKSDLIPI
jgi:hypothetical protein